MELKQKKTQKYLKISVAIVLIVLIVIVWYMVGKSLSNYPVECEPLMTSWCLACDQTDWVGKHKVGKDLAWCSNAYFYTGWAPNTDCTVSNAKEVCNAFIPP